MGLCCDDRFMLRLYPCGGKIQPTQHRDQLTQPPNTPTNPTLQPTNPTLRLYPCSGKNDGTKSIGMAQRDTLRRDGNAHGACTYSSRKDTEPTESTLQTEDFSALSDNKECTTITHFYNRVLHLNIERARLPVYTGGMQCNPQHPATPPKEIKGLTPSSIISVLVCIV